MFLDVIIMTMSSKNHGYCVAGIDYNNGEWVRLVSDDIPSHGALSKENTKYENGIQCAPLDVVRVPVLGANPKEHQPENMLIDERRAWIKIGTVTVYELLEIHPAEIHTYLFGNSGHCITENIICNLESSLLVVEVEDLLIEHPDERRTKASFNYLGNKYTALAVTDPEFYKYAGDKIEKALLVISLPDCPFNEKYYKFVSKIFLL